MKIALVQMKISWEDKACNYLEGEQAILCASKRKADLVLFPEMSFTGFSMNISSTYDDGTTEMFVLEMIKKYKIAIGYGWVKKYEDRAENHYTIIDETGQCLSDYVKIHPFSYARETDYFLGGNDIVTFEWKGYCWSTFICYDLRFPEIFQIVSEQADVIIVPANWPQKREEHWKTLLKARSIENQSYILGINCVGNIGGIEYSGYTSAYSPVGELIAESVATEDIVFIELQDTVKDIRAGFPVKADRKWDLYKELYDRQKSKSNTIEQ